MKKWVFLLVALLLLLAPLMGGCGAKKYDLTISVSPTGGGTTSPAAGTYKYKKDTSVTITATPATGYQFVKWTGDASGTTATATVTMTSDKSVGANFSKIQYTLTIAKVGNGTTTPTVGAHTYDSGTGVSITATPDTGWHFVNWSGDATGTTATVSVTMSANKTVTANFAISTYTLTMAKVGNGTIDPVAGAHTEDAGAVVNLTATADSGWQFVNWTGNVATVADVDDATTTVTMNGDYTITANFVQLFMLTIAKLGSGTGTTNPAVGAHDIVAGTPVSITATPATGSKFDNWSGDASGTNATVSVTMSADKTVTAHFSALAQFTLTMAVDDEAHVTTTTPPVGPNTVYEGSNNISATAATGWAFDHWSGDVSTVADVNAASTTITMDADYSIMANFVVSQATTYPGVNSVWNFTVTYGSEITYWTVSETALETKNSVDSYKTEDAFYSDAAHTTSTFPVRATTGSSTSTHAVTTWRSQTTLDTVESDATVLLGAFALHPVITDDYTGASNHGWPYSDGQTYTFVETTVIPELSMNTPVTLDVTVTLDTITVTAGTFDCYKITYADHTSHFVTKVEWYSPDVKGLVKIVTNTYDQTETQELTSFTLA